MSDLLIQSFLVSDVSKSLRSLTKNERCERIAQVAHQKWATMRYSLRSLRGNERLWANRSGRSPKMSEWMNHSFFWANCSFAHFWTKNEQFTWKSNEWIPSPAKWVPNTISLSAGNGEWFDVFLFLLFPTVYKRCSCVPFPVVPNSESLNTLNALGAHLW